MEKGSGLEFKKENPPEELWGRRYRKAGMEAEAGLQTERKQSLLLSKTDAEKLIRGDYRCLLDYDGDLQSSFTR